MQVSSHSKAALGHGQDGVAGTPACQISRNIFQQICAFMQVIKHNKAALGATGKVAQRVTAGSQAFLIAAVP